MSNRSRTVLLSPVVVLVVGNAAARISGHLWGVWSWIPVTLVYWITLAAILGCACGWHLLSFATTALFIPVFLFNFHSLNQPWVISCWLAIAAIDPLLEEGY